MSTNPFKSTDNHVPSYYYNAARLRFQAHTFHYFFHVLFFAYLSFGSLSVFIVWREQRAP